MKLCNVRDQRNFGLNMGSKLTFFHKKANLRQKRSNVGGVFDDQSS